LSIYEEQQTGEGMEDKRTGESKEKGGNKERTFYPMEGRERGLI